jgi:Mg2+ and Co2+ transporter CorA
MLFKEVNNTLNELYKSQENNASDRMNMLLFILTVFTVISGIYGMNLVIKDWESPTGWKAFSSYTIFEWVSLITAVSGIVLSGFLIFSTVRKLVMNKIRKRKSDNHFE